MADGSADLQTAIYTRLSGLSPGLAAGGVHAPGSQDQALPYVSIGETDTVAADVQCRDGLDEAITIHVWTRAGSWIAPKQIMSRIREALHFEPLTVTGRASAHVRVTSTRLFLDEDGQAVHGVMTVEVSHFGQLET